MNDPNDPLVLVVVDTSVLINFLHVDRIDLLGRPLALSVVVPVEVLAEVTDAAQRTTLDAAIAEGSLGDGGPLVGSALDEYARMHAFLGSGESAALALAQANGWAVACDEKRACLREAHRLLGPDRVTNTPGLLVRAIRRGAITIDEADGYKDTLERHRFRMSFASFRSLLSASDS